MSKNIIQLNEEAVKGELKELVRKSVEETLNEHLDKEAEELTGAVYTPPQLPALHGQIAHPCRPLPTDADRKAKNMIYLK